MSPPELVRIVESLIGIPNLITYYRPTERLSREIRFSDHFFWHSKGKAFGLPNEKIGGDSMDTTPETTGGRIKLLRQRLGMSRNAVAARAGVSQGNLSDIENEKIKDPRRDTLAKLAVVLKTSVSYLACEASDPSPPNVDAKGLYSADMPLPPIGWDDLSLEERRHVRDVTRRFEETIVEDILRRRRDEQGGDDA